MHRAQFDRSKMLELVLHVCSKCKPHELGAVKLHKVLYFVDMISFIDKGTPFTGATYRKRPYGPTCEQLSWALSALQKSGRLSIHDQTHFGFQKKIYTAEAQANLSTFSETEMALVDEVVDFVCRQNTARSISEISHTAAWELAAFGDELAYESALLMLVGPPSQEAFDLVGEEVDSIEAARSNRNPLDLESWASLRGRLFPASQAVQ